MSFLYFPGSHLQKIHPDTTHAFPRNICCHFVNTIRRETRVCLTTCTWCLKGSSNFECPFNFVRNLKIESNVKPAKKAVDFPCSSQKMSVASQTYLFFLSTRFLIRYTIFFKKEVYTKIHAFL